MVPIAPKIVVVWILAVLLVACGTRTSSDRTGASGPSAATPPPMSCPTVTGLDDLYDESKTGDATPELAAKPYTDPASTMMTVREGPDEAVVSIVSSSGDETIAVVRMHRDPQRGWIRDSVDRCGRPNND